MRLCLCTDSSKRPLTSFALCIKSYERTLMFYLFILLHARVVDSEIFAKDYFS